MLTNLNSSIEELAITASLSGDPTMVYHAIAHDPLTAVLSLAEIKQLVNEMFRQNEAHLPQFKRFAV
jgi:alpha-galactosidase